VASPNCQSSLTLTPHSPRSDRAASSSSSSTLPLRPSTFRLSDLQTFRPRSVFLPSDHCSLLPLFSIPCFFVAQFVITSPHES
jgi:hypothetical protein